MVALNSNNVPPEHVLEWCRQLVRVIRDGGSWGIPRSNLVFRIDHKKKQLVLTVGSPSDDDFEATRHVFSYIGWDVVAESKNNAAETGSV